MVHADAAARAAREARRNLGGRNDRLSISPDYPITDTTMSYTQDLEARLKQLLAGTPEGEATIIIREMKAIALESYRNGQKAGAPKSEKRATATAALAKKPYQR